MGEGGKSLHVGGTEDGRGVRWAGDKINNYGNDDNHRHDNIVVMMMMIMMTMV